MPYTIGLQWPYFRLSQPRQTRRHRCPLLPIFAIITILFLSASHISEAFQITLSNRGLNRHIILSNIHRQRVWGGDGSDGGSSGVGYRSMGKKGGLTFLRSAGDGEEAINNDVTNSNKNDSSSQPPVDVTAIFKYATGLTAQTFMIYTFLAIFMDKVLVSTILKGKLGLLQSTVIPTWANFVFFYMFNLKTSFFSILPINKQSGDKLQKNWDDRKRKQPSWTPPGYVFAIMWPLFVFGTRAYTASRVVGRLGGVYANHAVMALMLHLSVANLWNTVNNIERRLGVSVILLYLLWLTKAYAAYQFWRIDKITGQLLALTLTWLTAAAALETNTWLINPDPDTGRVEPLYPAKVKGKWKTVFRWE